jgi:nitroimidazol reductase NimA-like FMN-containing flavoprotein (pyridoxamine 5'-phosphate oxidase superfamily)
LVRQNFYQQNFATKYESVIAFGRIKKSTDKQKILKKIVEKYSLDYMESGEKYILKAMNKVTVYEFEIEYMSAKAKK